METNYVNDLLETRKKEIATVDYLENQLLSAQKFRLPIDGVVLDVLNIKEIREQEVDFDIRWFFDNYLPIAKLPYPVITLEYLQNHENSINVKTILLIDVSPNEKQWRINYFYNVYSNGVARTKGWQPFFYTLIFDVPLMQYDFISNPMANDTQLDKEMHEHFTNELLMALYVLLSFLAALNCSNIEQKDQLAPVKLNKKRESNGKLPLFDYKVLTINTKETISKKGESTGTHASPRQHLRRGHIRRLKNKHVWVNSCVVGDATKGMVKKDYNII